MNRRVDNGDFDPSKFFTKGDVKDKEQSPEQVVADRESKGKSDGTRIVDGGGFYLPTDKEVQGSRTYWENIKDSMDGVPGFEDAAKEVGWLLADLNRGQQVSVQELKVLERTLDSASISNSDIQKAA